MAGAVALATALVVAPAGPAATVQAAPDGATGPSRGVAAAVPAGPAKPLTVKGKVSGAGKGAVVLLVGADGTSVSTRLSAKGAFTLKVTNPRLLAGLRTGPGRTGPALHLVRSGVYAGPFVLRTKKKQGYGRLAVGTSGTVDLGTASYRSPGYVRLKAALGADAVDTRHPMRLSSGVPLGAGSFGATGSLRATAWRSRSAEPAAAGALPPFEALPVDADGLGSDADQDGVPNVADVDMNGDDVLDAAQADAPLPTQGGGTLAGDQVLSNRPVTAIQFGKILSSDSRVSVNSNVAGEVTWQALRDFGTENGMIETLIAPGDLRQLFCPGTPLEQPCPGAQAVTRVTMDCRTQPYCGPGSQATVVGGDPNQPARPLSSLINADGVIEMPVDTHGPAAGGGLPADTGFQLNFKPRTDGAAIDLVGDSFEFVFYDANGTELARQVKVLTSSVAAPPEFVSVGGQPVVRPTDWQNPIVVPLSSALAFEMYRPQRLDTQTSPDAPVPVLLDRGGLEYDVYVMSRQGFYWCRSSQVTPTSEGLTKVTQPFEQVGRNEPLFDTVMDPPNGGRLAFSLDLAGCLSDPANGPGGPPAAEDLLTVEVEVSDSDGNRTRTQAMLRVG